MKKQDFVAATIAALAILLYIYHSSFTEGLQKLRLLPHSEPYTELYIEDFMQLSDRLPNTIKQGEVVAFSFAIHNHQGKQTAYPYVVYFIDEKDATTTIDSGLVTLADNGSTTIAESYMFATPQRQITVFVSLTDLDQSVHFSVPPKN